MGWMFGGRAFTLSINLLISVYIARKLGPEQFGTLNFIMSFVGIAGVTLFSIDSLLMKRLHHDDNNKEKLLGSALIIKLIKE